MMLSEWAAACPHVDAGELCKLEAVSVAFVVDDIHQILAQLFKSRDTKDITIVFTEMSKNSNGC
jgi:hypothetical protein